MAYPVSSRMRKNTNEHTSGISDALGNPVDGEEHRRILAVVRYLGR